MTYHNFPVKTSVKATQNFTKTGVEIRFLKVLARGGGPDKLDFISACPQKFELAQVFCFLKVMFSVVFSVKLYTFAPHMQAGSIQPLTNICICNYCPFLLHLQQ